MARRLTELYQSGMMVEIRFGDDEQWWLGQVVGHQPPGVWVQTINGRYWFVTNGRRIQRQRLEADSLSEKTTSG